MTDPKHYARIVNMTHQLTSLGWTFDSNGMLRISASSNAGKALINRYGFAVQGEWYFSSLEEAVGWVLGFAACQQFIDLRAGGKPKNRRKK